jgi:hypothetical protein
LFVIIKECYIFMKMYTGSTKEINGSQVENPCYDVIGSFPDMHADI